MIDACLSRAFDLDPPMLAARQGETLADEWLHILRFNHPSTMSSCVSVLEERSTPSSVSVLLAARDAAQIRTVVTRLTHAATTWVIALGTIDEAARELKRMLNQAGHDCLLVCADFRDPVARKQVIAMACDFAGALTLIWSCNPVIA